MVTEETVQSAPISARRLWFGFAAAAVAWASLGIIDIVITWRACVHQERSGYASPHPEARALYIAAELVLFCILLAAGTLSYRNWRILSQQRAILNSLATERREFMALVGVITSVALGMGVIWLSIPPFWIELCLRTK